MPTKKTIDAEKEPVLPKKKPAAKPRTVLRKKTAEIQTSAVASAVIAAVPEAKEIAVSPQPEKPVSADAAAAERPKGTQLFHMQVAAKPKMEKYFEAVGRRKRATARVRLYTSNPQNSAEAGNIIVNGHPYKEYFNGERLFVVAEDALKKLKSMNRFRATVIVKGGGVHAQAEAVRHGLARALTIFDLNFRKRLKRAGFLKRDPREKERKKYGLKKARRAPQWTKR